VEKPDLPHGGVAGKVAQQLDGLPLGRAAVDLVPTMGWFLRRQVDAGSGGAPSERAALEEAGVGSQLRSTMKSVTAMRPAGVTVIRFRLRASRPMGMSAVKSVSIFRARWRNRSSSPPRGELSTTPDG